VRLHKQTDTLLEGYDWWKRFSWVLMALGLITSCFSVSIVPFTRRNFGERYFGWINLFFAYTVVANFAFLGNLIGVGLGHGWSWLMVLCWLGFIAASIWHRMEISRKNRASVEWHSMYTGDSILPLPFSQEKIFKFFEPAAVVTAGLLIWYFSGAVGAWLVIGGISLLVNNHIVYFTQRQAILDIRDRQIEARYLSDAVAGKPAKQTGGFVLAQSNLEAIKHDPGLQKAFANLSNELKSLLDAPSELQAA